MIKGDIIREMAVDAGQKYQEKVEASDNMLFKPKQRDQLNKGY